MEQLTDDHLSHLLEVLASDLVFKRDTLINIRAEERMLQTQSTSRAGGGSICTVCSKPLEGFNRQTDCSVCCRRVCSKCHNDKICKCCLARKDIEKKRKQFSMICPFARNQFGYAKLACDEAKVLDKTELMQRAKLEMHLTTLLEADLDSCDVLLSIKDPRLEKCRRRLVGAVRSSALNRVDEAIDEIKRCMTKDNSALESDASIRIGTYPDIISFAVVSTVVKSKKSSSSEKPTAAPWAPSTSAVVAPKSAPRRNLNSNSQTPKANSSRSTNFDVAPETERRGQEKIRPRDAWQSKSVPANSQKTELYPRCACERRRELERLRRQLQQVVETNLLLTRTNQQLLDMVDELLRRAFASKQHVRSVRTRQVSREDLLKTMSDSLEN